MTYSSIPTSYQGVHMRSRLEASTAALCDALGIRWRYETEGFDLNGVWYLPDFFLPEVGPAGCFVEVKGILDDRSLEKARDLARACLARNPSLFVLIMSDPFPDEDGFIHALYISPKAQSHDRRVRLCSDGTRYMWWHPEGVMFPFTPIRVPTVSVYRPGSAPVEKTGEPLLPVSEETFFAQAGQALRAVSLKERLR